MTDRAKLDEFAEVTDKSIEHVLLMIELEKEKRQALLNQDMALLEGVLQRQQAMIMKSENLERARLEAQEKAGFHGLTGREVIDSMGDDSSRAEFEAKFKKLRDSAKELQDLNKIGLEIANMNLKVFEAITGSAAISQQSTPGTYGRRGSKKGGSTSFEEKI